MVALRVHIKKVKMSYFFIMHNMITTVISVVNSLDRDQILDFQNFFFPQNFSFP